MCRHPRCACAGRPAVRCSVVLERVHQAAQGTVGRHDLLADGGAHGGQSGGHFGRADQFSDGHDRMPLATTACERISSCRGGPDRDGRPVGVQRFEHAGIKRHLVADAVEGVARHPENIDHNTRHVAVGAPYQRPFAGGRHARSEYHAQVGCGNGFTTAVKQIGGVGDPVREAQQRSEGKRWNDELRQPDEEPLDRPPHFPVNALSAPSHSNSSIGRSKEREIR